jgi:hypothetical protein
MSAIRDRIIYLLLMHINYTKEFHCDITIHAYNVLQSSSCPLLLFWITHALLIKTIFVPFFFCGTEDY